VSVPASQPLNGRPKIGHVGAWLSVTFILILIVAAAPLIVSFAGGGVASALGCQGTMEISPPCAFMGNEISQTLTTMIFMGYFAFYSLPFGSFLLAVWAVIACVVVLVRWLRRRRAA
jgi:hypothetical protein